MSLQITTDLIRDLYTNVQTTFNKEFDARKVQVTYPGYSMIIKSTTLTENYPFFAPIGDAVEWLDERQTEELEGLRHSLTNKDWEKTIKIHRNELEDEQYGMIAHRVKGLGKVMARHPEKYVASLLNDHMDGTNTDFTDGFDGRALFSLTHTWTVGSYSTDQVNVRGNVGNEGKIDQVYGYDNLKAGITAMQLFKNPWGEPMGFSPDTLVVAPDVQWDAAQILRSTELNLAVPGTDAPLDIVYERGTMNPLAGRMRIVINKYLSAGTGFMYESGASEQGILFQNRQDVRFSALTDIENSERAFMRKEYLFGADARYAIAPAFWFNIFGFDGT